MMAIMLRLTVAEKHRTLMVMNFYILNFQSELISTQNESNNKSRDSFFCKVKKWKFYSHSKNGKFKRGLTSTTEHTYFIRARKEISRCCDKSQRNKDRLFSDFRSSTDYDRRSEATLTNGVAHSSLSCDPFGEPTTPSVLWRLHPPIRHDAPVPTGAEIALAAPCDF